MGVVTFVDYVPAPRFDGFPWASVRVEESATATGTFAVIDTFTLSPVDADPENPVARSFTTENASNTIGMWYRLVWIDASADEEQPTEPVQHNAFSIYAGTVELARILKIRTPSDEQEAAMRRVLAVAAGEINAEIDLAADDYLESWQLALASQVNLQRAAELWFQQEVPLGVAGLGSEFGSVHLARNSWDKYAYTLAPLKKQWGIA